MSKHLSIEEKHNALTEFNNNKETIRKLRQEIRNISKRNIRLYNYLKNIQKSNYNGLFYETSDTYKMFKKPRTELAPDELKQYNKLKQQESRLKRKLKSI